MRLIVLQCDHVSPLCICDCVRENQPYVGENNTGLHSNFRHIYTSEILFFTPEASLMIVEFGYLL